MDSRPPKNYRWELRPSAQKGKFDFRVRRNDSELGPNDAVIAGTTYALSGLSEQPAVDVWGSYVAAGIDPGPEGSGFHWQNFVSALPTTPTVTEKIDPFWGKVYEVKYLDLVTNTKPDRGSFYGSLEAFTLQNGTAFTTISLAAFQAYGSGTGLVLDVTETDKGQGLCEVSLIIPANPLVTETDQVVDEESGSLINLTKTTQITTTQPSGSAPNSFGIYTESKRKEHNIYETLTQPVSGLPLSRAAAIVVQSMGSISWPAVLEGVGNIYVIGSDEKWNNLIANSVREPHADAVKVTTRFWQQNTQPSFSDPVSLIPAAISIRAVNQSFSIPETLHSALTFQEFEYVVSLDGGTDYLYHQMVIWSVSATNYTEWPATLVRLQVDFKKGMYICREQTYYRPTSTSSSTISISTRDATTAERLLVGA